MATTGTKINGDDVHSDGTVGTTPDTAPVVGHAGHDGSDEPVSGMGVIPGPDTAPVGHARQSANGCVLCPRKWSDHTPEERAFPRRDPVHAEPMSSETALRRYGDHDDDCGVRQGSWEAMSDRCTCGFSAALAISDSTTGTAAEEPRT